MRLVLAARRSELARIQAFQVGRALDKANPQLTIEYSFHESLGDRNQNDPLWQMPDKGVFTQDLRTGLADGRGDVRQIGRQHHRAGQDAIDAHRQIACGQFHREGSRQHGDGIF